MSPIILDPPSAQEEFWRGSFGDEYTDRHSSTGLVASQIQFFRRALSLAGGVESVLELGANVGHNLTAIQSLLPGAYLNAVEINAKAVDQLRLNMPDVDVYPVSLFDFQPTRTWDLVFTYGVLIHICPDRLGEVYDLMYRASGRYILMAEYYNPIPVEIPYRGHQGKLFKRDFAGEMLDRFSDLSLIDYGFVYRRDRKFPADDVTWFLMEKI